VKRIIVFALCMIAMQLGASLEQEKPLVVVIPAYNSAQFYKKNLDSIFSQKYGNYRVIYIDDCSTDGTYELVMQYVHECGQEHRVTIMRNEVNQGIFANHYRAVRQCHDYEIVLNVDSDDWLVDDQVFNKVNQAYMDPNIWMTYGQFKSWPEDKAGFCKRSPQHVVEHNAYREFTWRASHLRTFYAWLFKRIKLKDCIYQDGMYRLCADMVMMYPMLEMAGDRHLHVMSDVLYVYNESEAKPCYGEKYLSQLHLSREIRNGTKYTPLADDDSGPALRPDNTGVSIVVESHSRPIQLYALLDSLQENGKNIASIRVLYEVESPEVEVAYQQLYQQFTEVEFTRIMGGHHFKSAVLEELQSSPASYIAFTSDELVLHKPLDFKECIDWLEYTQARAYYPALGKNICFTESLEREQAQPPFIFLDSDMYAWQFKNGEHDWRCFMCTHLALYRKSDIRAAVSDVYFNSFAQLSSLLAHHYIEADAVGLCSAVSTVMQPVYTGQRVSPDDLCELFNYGFKIDVGALGAITARSLKCQVRPLLKPRAEKSYA